MRSVDRPHGRFKTPSTSSKSQQFPWSDYNGIVESNTTDEPYNADTRGPVSFRLPYICPFPIGIERCCCFDSKEEVQLRRRTSSLPTDYALQKIGITREWRKNSSACRPLPPQQCDDNHRPNCKPRDSSNPHPACALLPRLLGQSSYPYLSTFPHRSRFHHT